MGALRFLWSPCGFSLVCSDLRAKYSGAVKDVSMRMWRICASYKPGFRLADPQLTAVFAESQDERRERHYST